MYVYMCDSIFLFVGLWVCVYLYISGFIYVCLCVIVLVFSEGRFKSSKDDMKLLIYSVLNYLNDPR